MGFVCLWTMASMGGTAFGQEDREEEARALFMAGRAAYDAGRYEAALERFQEAYELSGRGELLYNIGQSADRLRRDEVALDAFERFLTETSAGTPNREIAERRVQFLRRSVASAEAPDPASVDPQPEDPDATEPEPDLAPEAMDAEDLALETEDSPPPPAEEQSGGSKWWIGVIVGVVVVGLAVGLAVGLSGGDGGEPQYAESDLGRTIFALGEWQ